jgi:hypothetical protein
MDPFNALSTAAAARKIPPLKEAPLAKVMLCALVTSTDLEKTLDAVKEVTRGAVAPSAKMAGRPWLVANRSSVMRADHHQHGKVPLYLRSWNVPGSRSFPSSNDRECAPIGHAHTSHYGDSHSEEGDHPTSTCGPFEQ